MSTYKGALCYPSIDQFQSFVIRRSDRLIWVHLCVRNNRGGLAIAETTPLEITASLLPASEMKQQLDDDGTVTERGTLDRKSVERGKDVAVRVELGGRGRIKNNN